MSKSASQLSTKYFYKSHLNEVSKYITNEMSYINIVNSNSNVPSGMFKNEIRVDTDTSLEQIFDEFSKDNKYDLIILTDIFELTDDLYSTLKTIKSYLNKDGKLMLTSINPFWNFLMSSSGWLIRRYWLGERLYDLSINITKKPIIIQKKI